MDNRATCSPYCEGVNLHRNSALRVLFKIGLMAFAKGLIRVESPNLHRNNALKSIVQNGLMSSKGLIC